MQCNTNYTGSLSNFNFIELNVLKTFKKEFGDIILGLSDHTPGHTTVLGAVTLGASVIEKHFTDDVSIDGPDHKFSMDPVSWKEMVERTKELESSLGTGRKIVMENEKETIVLQRRAVRARNKINKGQIIKKDDIICLRPCPPDGLPPYKANEIINKTSKQEIEKEDIITLKLIE